MSAVPLQTRKKRERSPSRTSAPLHPVAATAELQVPTKKKNSPALPKPVSVAPPQQAVSSFSVQLGEGATPNPDDVGKLLSSSKLQHLKVTIITTAGSEALTTEEQCILCASQSDMLLNTIKPALTPVTHLHLAIEHRTLPAIPAPVAKPGYRVIMPPPIPTPADLAIMANSVLAKLLPAMPALVQLSLEGSISQETLEAFDSTFSQIHTLQIEAVSVPVETVQYLCPKLSSLIHFVLATQQADNSSTGQGLLKQYVPAAFSALQTCSKLIRVDLALANDTWLNIPPTAWEFLPASLEELRSTFSLSINRSDHIPSLRKIRRLVLARIYDGDIESVMRDFSGLQELTITSNTEVCIETYADKAPEDIQHLMGIFDGGLVLRCKSVKLEGKCRSLRDLLELIPPLPDTVNLTLGLRGKRPHDFCLEDIARVFPRLRRLTLMSFESLCRAEPMTSEAFVAPLLKCTFLERLQLSVQLRFSTASLEKLCLGLPRLSFLNYFPFKGVDDEQLKVKVQAKRPGFELMPCVGHGYYA